MFASILTLTGALAISSGAVVFCAAEPNVPKKALAEKAPPKSWKISDLNSLITHPTDSGPVTVLVWEIIECESLKIHTERCLVVKQYADPKQDGERFVLAHFERSNFDKRVRWKRL